MVKIQVDSLGKAIMLNNRVLEATGSGEPTDGFLVQAIDYDGTILKKARLNTGDTFTLPSAPTHTGLVFDGWSSPTLIQNNKVTVSNQDIIIGPTYDTVSGLSEFDITLTSQTNKTVHLNMNGTKNWGDGTTDTSNTHIYSSYGDYTITCDGDTLSTTDASGLFGQSSNSKNYYCTGIRLTNVATITHGAFQYCYSLRSVTLSNDLLTVQGSTMSGTRGAFQGCYSLRAIVIPDSGITRVGENDTFAGCQSLTYAVFPRRVSSMIGYVFFNCSSLLYFTFPDSCTSVGGYNFKGCYSLKRISFPYGLRWINADICSGCSSLQVVRIPNTVQQISENAFYNCVALTDINIPESVTRIENSAFYGCNSLANIDIPDNAVLTGGLSNCFALHNIEYSGSIAQSFSNSNMYTLQELVLPNGITSVPNCGNNYCLQKIEFPSSVTSLTSFQNCTSMVEYNFKRHLSIPSLSSSSAFTGISPICKIKVPFDLYMDWCEATNWSRYAEYIDGGNPATLNFIAPANTDIYVRGSLVASSMNYWGPSVTYVAFDENNNIASSETVGNITEGSTVNITVDLTSYNKITLSTGVTGLTAIATINGVDFSMIEESSGNYSINVVGSGIMVDYFIGGGSNYMDANGNITTTGSDITEAITLIPAAETTFVRPNLTADGTIGGSSFAVKDVGAGTLTTTYAWRAVDDSATTYWNGSSPSSGNKTYVFYNPDVLKVSELTYIYSSTMYKATAVSIEGSNDNSTWESITSSYSGSSTTYTSTLTNSKSYKYYKLTFTPYSSYVRIYDLAITATVKVPAS